MNPLKDPRFLKRLRLYFFGFLIGILFVIFLFRDRFPEAVDEDKLRDSFESDSLVLSADAEQGLDSLGLTLRAFRDSLLKGDFILPEHQGEAPRSFHIVTNGEPSMKVRMKVLDGGRTRAEAIRFPE